MTPPRSTLLRWALLRRHPQECLLLAPNCFHAALAAVLGCICLLWPAAHLPSFPTCQHLFTAWCSSSVPQARRIHMATPFLKSIAVLSHNVFACCASWVINMTQHASSANSPFSMWSFSHRILPPRTPTQVLPSPCMLPLPPSPPDQQLISTLCMLPPPLYVYAPFPPHSPWALLPFTGHLSPCNAGNNGFYIILVRGLNMCRQIDALVKLSPPPPPSLRPLSSSSPLPV